jgi:hypothetical protein
MKKNNLMLLMLCFIAMQGFAQSLADKTLTFYGIDFSKARMLGGGFSDPDEIKAKLFNQWNGLFRSEPDKYDWIKYLVLITQIQCVVQR